jgi:hypothetical protein
MINMYGIAFSVDRYTFVLEVKFTPHGRRPKKLSPLCLNLKQKRISDVYKFFL